MFTRSCNTLIVIGYLRWWLWRENMQQHVMCAKNRLNRCPHDRQPMMHPCSHPTTAVPLGCESFCKQLLPDLTAQNTLLASLHSSSCPPWLHTEPPSCAGKASLLSLEDPLLWYEAAEAPNPFQAQDKGQGSKTNAAHVVDPAQLREEMEAALGNEAAIYERDIGASWFDCLLWSLKLCWCQYLALSPCWLPVNIVVGSC